jgi:predicted secreted protein
MSTPLAIALYLTIWWIVIFAVLPFGIQSQHEVGTIVPGTDPGAPAVPRLGRAAAITTAISLAIWLPLYLALTRGWIDLDRIPFGGF